MKRSTYKTAISDNIAEHCYRHSKSTTEREKHGPSDGHRHIQLMII